MIAFIDDHRTVYGVEPIVRRCTRLPADKAPRQSLEEPHNLRSAHCFRTTMSPFASTPWSWKTFFARSIPTVVISPMDGSPLVFLDDTILARSDAVRGHPPYYFKAAPNGDFVFSVQRALRLMRAICDHELFCSPQSA